MKTHLNCKEVSFILNQSEDWAIAVIAKANGIEIMKRPSPVAFNKDKKEFKDWMTNFKAHRISIEQLSEISKIDVRKLIKDIDSNFLKNKECVEYLMKKVTAKMKPNSQGFMPLSITIPPEITSFMSQDSISTMIDYLRINFASEIKYVIKSA